MSSRFFVVAWCVLLVLATSVPLRAQTLELPRRMQAVVVTAAETSSPGTVQPAAARDVPAARVVAAPYRALPAPEPAAPAEQLPVPSMAFASDGPEYIQVQSIEVLEAPEPQGGPVVYEPMAQPYAEAGQPVFEDLGQNWDGMLDGRMSGTAGCQECQGDPSGMPCPACEQCKTWQILPTGVIYHSYLAGPKEPRFAATFWRDRRLGWQLDYTVGGRMGLVRYGTQDKMFPQGFEIDIEGAAFPRVNLEENMDLDAADYRVGLPLTYGKDKWQVKFEIYHLSAHVGDEYLIRHPDFERINYVRDAFVLGYSCYPVNLLRLYAETEWAFNRDGGAKPWAFQFGFELSPRRYNGFSGDPFLALNTSLRQDVDFGGNLCLQTGWQWRGPDTQRLLRIGFHLLTGKSNQFEFYDQNETQVGMGLWYDF